VQSPLQKSKNDHATPPCTTIPPYPPAHCAPPLEGRACEPFDDSSGLLAEPAQPQNNQGSGLPLGLSSPRSRRMARLKSALAFRSVIAARAALAVAGGVSDLFRLGSHRLCRLHHPQHQPSHGTYLDSVSWVLPWPGSEKALTVSWVLPSGVLGIVGVTVIHVFVTVGGDGGLARMRRGEYLRGRSACQSDHPEARSPPTRCRASRLCGGPFAH